MHLKQAIAVSETINPRGEKKMKKVVTTLTALSFVLGLALSGSAQSTAPKDLKPAVQTQVQTQTQTPAAGSQVTPAEKEKGQAAGQVQAKEENKGQVQEKGKNPGKKGNKQESAKKPGTSTTETKSDLKKDETKEQK